MKSTMCGVLAKVCLVGMACVGSLSAGCEQKDASAQASSPVRLELNAASQGKVEQALASYENVRAKLAKDDLAGIVADVTLLERSANEAAAVAPAATQGVLKALAAAAKSLREIDKGNADEVRKSFGEVSRQLVTLMVGVESLQQGRFIFFCPMAQGYGKWVQTKPQLENPYMGTRMLACGSASDWSV